MKFLLAAVFTLGLTACASKGVEQYRAEQPALDLKTYLNGTLDAWGIFQGRSGDVKKRFQVRIEAKKLRYGCEFFASLYPEGADAGHSPRVVTSTGEVLTGPLAYAWYVEDVQSTLGAVNDHHVADTLLRSVGAGAPEVDDEALVEAGIRACERLAAIDPFWQ